MTTKIQVNGVTYEVTHHLVPTVLNQNGHHYRLLKTTPHKNSDGRPSWILTWLGRCAECGAGFEVTSGPSISLHLNRRCPAHHNPSSKATPWKAGAT